jgi:hypothetical protein
MSLPSAHAHLAGPAGGAGGAVYSDALGCDHGRFLRSGMALVNRSGGGIAARAG